MDDPVAASCVRAVLEAYDFGPITPARAVVLQLAPICVASEREGLRP